VAGVARFFVDLSLAALGRIAGGPAQAAVISSLFMGTVSGSPIAETVTTGTVTIPLMKRTGFPPHIAAAVEGAASTGAMIMPPVMGAGAFIMAEMTNISYLEIIKVATIPGILFYLSVAIMVYFESRKLGLRGLRRDELPRFGEVMRRGWYFFIPIVVLMGALIIGYAPGTAAVFGIATAVVLSWLTPGARLGPARIWEALVEGGKASLYVAALTGAVGILIGVLALTGIGIRFSYSPTCWWRWPAGICPSRCCCSPSPRWSWGWRCPSPPPISWWRSCPSPSWWIWACPSSPPT
jgi:TRAP transporter 4TM/12TM fusion protein